MSSQDVQAGAALNFGPVTADLDLVEQCLIDSAEGRHPLLAEALRYVFDRRGKRLRPALVLLAGALGEYDLDRLVWLAASLEVVHTASLVHDDTIDEALTRRGFGTINSLWDRHTAIVTGDYLFARSAELASRIDSVRIMHMLSLTVMDMCAGEIRQHARQADWSIDANEYLERIGSKTASLFAMCCAGAGVVSGQDEDRVQALATFGREVGAAFQIVDDILDFESDERTLGKPAGNDLRHGTITLPAILFLQDLAPDSPLRERLRHGEDAELAIELIRESNALSRARECAHGAAQRAINALGCFGDGPAARTLRQIADNLPTRGR